MYQPSARDTEILSILAPSRRQRGATTQALSHPSPHPRHTAQPPAAQAPHGTAASTHAHPRPTAVGRKRAQHQHTRERTRPHNTRTAHQATNTQTRNRRQGCGPPQLSLQVGGASTAGCAVAAAYGSPGHRAAPVAVTLPPPGPCCNHQSQSHMTAQGE